jgi:hypothetical protein
LDNVHYTPIDTPIYHETAQKFRDVLATLERKKYINKTQHNYLSPPPQIRPRQFYLLPKIHKALSKWAFGTIPPGRPIVSDCGSEGYHIAEFIDFHLKKVSMSHPSYIKNTQDFLQKISQVNVPRDALLVTMDVESLYTNISTDDGIAAVRTRLQDIQDTDCPLEEILTLLRLSLERNDFVLGKNTYLQTLGCAMGKKFAPNYANIFMADLEETVLQAAPLKPSVFLRYLDDIFMVWPHSENDLSLFVKQFNSTNRNINLTAEVNFDSVDFLDVTIFKGNRFGLTGILDSKVYFKPTATHDLIRRDSYHPKSVGIGVIKSQVTRFYRNCSSPRYVEEACNIAFHKLPSLGYSPRLTRRIKNSTLAALTERHQVGISPCSGPRCMTCTLIAKGNNFTINNTPLNISQALGCASRYVIYAIRCKLCHLVYIGQTSQALRDRVTGHRSDVSNQKDTAVGTHFNSPGHEFHKHAEVLPLHALEPFDNPRTTKLHLLQLENKFIKKFNTLQPLGLNLELNEGASPFITFISTYNHEHRPLEQKIRRTYEQLQTEHPETFPQKILFAYNRNPNIKDFTVRTAFK